MGKLWQIAITAIALATISCDHVNDNEITAYAAGHNQEKILEILGNECEHDGTKLMQERYEFYLKLADKYNLKSTKEWIEINAIHYQIENAIKAIWACDAHPSSLEMAVLATSNPKTFDYALKFDHALLYGAIRKKIIVELETALKNGRNPPDFSNHPKFEPFSENWKTLQAILKSDNYSRFESLNAHYEIYQKQLNEIRSIDESDRELSSKWKTLDDEYRSSDPLSNKRMQINIRMEEVRSLSGELAHRRIEPVQSIIAKLKELLDLVKAYQNIS